MDEYKLIAAFVERESPYKSILKIRFGNTIPIMCASCAFVQESYEIYYRPELTIWYFVSRIDRKLHCKFRKRGISPEEALKFSCSNWKSRWGDYFEIFEGKNIEVAFVSNISQPQPRSSGQSLDAYCFNDDYEDFFDYTPYDTDYDMGPAEDGVMDGSD